MKPKDAFIAVTWACNARCQMCNVWKIPPVKLLRPEEFTKLPSSLRTVNISGGEPFLRGDLVEVVRAMHSVLPNARFVFSTNGSLTNSIVSKLEEIRAFHPKVGVGVSIDGIGPVHDKIRGVPGIYDRAVATVKKLKEAGFSDLRIAMTLVEENVHEVMRVYELSRELGVEFTMTLAHDSDLHFRKSDNVSSGLLEGVSEELPRVLMCQLRSNSVKNWLRAYHTKGIIDPAHRHRTTSRCEAGRSYFFMSAEGDIYPCNVLSEKIGNLSAAKSWDELSTKDAERRMRSAVLACRKDCWMICNARSQMMAHPARTAAWVAKNKVAAHIVRKNAPAR